MRELERRLVRNAELKRYMRQLTELVGREVTDDQLSSIKEIERLREAYRQLENFPKTTIELTPEDLKRRRFTSFVQNLAKAHSGPVSIWLDATPYCGTFCIPRVDEFNFSFQLNFIPEGIVELLTEEGGDRLLLDFSPDEVEVELQGEKWGDVGY